MENINLNEVATCDLVNELKKRIGVESMSIAEPLSACEVSIKITASPAIVLVVTD